MQTWQWLYKPQTPFTWRFIRNVLIKAAILFVVLNVLFVLLDPLSALGKLSAYNILFDGRERLPYGENPSQSYNLSLYQLDAMLASHEIDEASKKDDEYRVLLIGDSSVWGVLLKPEHTLAGQINANAYRTETDQHVRVHNLGYPTMSLTKDLMLLQYGLEYDPDLVVWMLTLESFGQKAQIDSAIVKNNAATVQALIEKYELNLKQNDARFVEYDTWDKTIMGRRRALADMLRLQFYGVAWAVTGIDQEYPEDYKRRAVDLQDDANWHGYAEGELNSEALAFDVLQAGLQMADEIPVLLVNEPMLISQGENSDIRYNFFYPQWAYDFYREQLIAISTEHDWALLDLWDALPDADCYTDSAVHLTPDCSAQLGTLVGNAIVQMADSGTLQEK